MGSLNWILMLLALAMLVGVLEIFVPSGGILGIAALLLLLASILMVGFAYGPTAGFACLAVAVVAVPAIVMIFLRWWPNTSMGRRFLPPIPSGDDVLPDTPQLRGLRELVGKIGRAKSKMLPSGAAEIEGQTVNAISEGVAIEAGQLVRVIQVRGNRVVVRPADDLTIEMETSEPVSAETKLSQPIESLGLDALGLDPLEGPKG